MSGRGKTENGAGGSMRQRSSRSSPQPLLLTLRRTSPGARAGVMVATGLIAELGRRQPVEALRIDNDLIVLRSTGHEASLLLAELRDVLASRRFDGWTLDDNPTPAG